MERGRLDLRPDCAVESLPQRHDETRFLVNRYASARHGTRYLAADRDEFKRDFVLQANVVSGVWSCSNLGDDRLRTQPHHRVVRLMNNERSVRENTERRSRRYGCGHVGSHGPTFSQGVPERRTYR